jgi:hypothetical protein
MLKLNKQKQRFMHGMRNTRFFKHNFAIPTLAFFPVNASGC